MKKIIITLFILFFIPLMGYSEKTWEVYFTNPDKIKNIKVINPQEGLISVIKGAKKSFYGAFYDISSMKIANEIIAAYKRGVDVKLVTDKGTFSGGAITKIFESGIPIVPNTSQGLMHNKFAIIDGSAVFTGSYNTTENCTHKNNNNAIIINSVEIAGIYLSKFSQMFDHGIFGNNKKRGAFAHLQREYYVKLDDMDINVHFAPEDNVEKIIHGRIAKAKKSIRFMQFSFTSEAISGIIIKKFKEGIDVKGVFERKGSNTEYSQYTKMKIENVPVRLDGNRYMMHHKVIIIDDHIVITGSFNISKNANRRNDENIIIIGSEKIALKYIEEFNRIYRKAK
ncbi:MAG: phospholipase D-like domain-containing protein [Leptospirales bacterium]|nr:phospholipase D-like domain-containing protein [Leptospirales bacterium]